ncbi:MAG: nuclear transport factor 2 family protein [Pseudomonadota bacterium]
MKLFSARESTQVDNGANKRRSFLKQLGLGVSAAVGSATTLVKADSHGSNDSLSLKLATLEAEKALRSLHQQYEQALDQGQLDAVIALFADDAKVIFNGGEFRGREQGISRLYHQHFAASNSGKRMEVAPGFALASAQQQEQLNVATDLLSAQAVFPYSIQVGKSIESATSLAAMARLHGEGVHMWWEGGVYELHYVKDAKDGTWRIKQLAYNTLARADYRTGRSYAKTITVPAFATRFPEDSRGPDALV